jgi:hypothetical protein
MAIKKDLKRGPKYEQGYSKNQILLLLCNLPGKIEEPYLRDSIKKRLDITDPKGIKKHLAELENEGLLFKDLQQGKENIWSLQTSSFLKLIEWFNNTPEFKDFHTSVYCQSMITPELIESLLKKWVYPSDYELFDEINNRKIKAYDHFKNNPIDTVLKILKISPTALKIAFIEQPDRNPLIWDTFKTKMLAAVILDGSNLAEVPGSVYGWLKGTIELKVGIDDNGKYLHDMTSIKMAWGDMRKVPGFEMPVSFDCSTEEGIQKNKQFYEKWGLG